MLVLCSRSFQLCANTARSYIQFTMYTLDQVPKAASIRSLLLLGLLHLLVERNEISSEYPVHDNRQANTDMHM